MPTIVQGKKFTIMPKIHTESKKMAGLGVQQAK